MVVQRFSRYGNEPVSLWQLSAENPPRRLNHNADGQFLITPDGETLVISQNQGIAMVPLYGPSSNQFIDFWPKFHQILSFAVSKDQRHLEKVGLVCC